MQKFITFSCFLLVRYSLTLSFTGTRIILGRLTTYRKTLAMTKTTVTSDVHQTLDAQLDLRLENTFDLELLSNDRTNRVRFFIIPFLTFLSRY